MEVDPHTHEAVRSAAKTLASSIDSAALRRQFQGAEYRKLVQEHMRLRPSKLAAAILGEVATLTHVERQVAEALIDAWNAKALDEDFWRRDCGEVFDEIRSDFGQRMEANGLAAEDWLGLHIFQLVTMSFAQNLKVNAELRQLAGTISSEDLRGATPRIVTANWLAFAGACVLAQFLQGSMVALVLSCAALVGLLTFLQRYTRRFRLYLGNLGKDPESATWGDTAFYFAMRGGELLFFAAAGVFIVRFLWGARCQ
ncbi:MAG: hypothetical protein FJ291_03605 [Planctomycetes bacterium]|nr:hypothetical protein [Planctomycetota bacterium]